MDPRGFEPLVSSMPWKRDSRYATGPDLKDYNIILIFIPDDVFGKITIVILGLWFNGRIQHSHCCDPGSIPGRSTSIGDRRFDSGTVHLVRLGTSEIPDRNSR